MLRPRTDGNHAAIVAVLRQLGWRVKSTAGVPEWVDLTVQDGSGRTYLIEVKRNAKATLKPSQKKLLADGWGIWRLDSVEDAERWSRERNI